MGDYLRSLTGSDMIFGLACFIAGLVIGGFSRLR